MNERERLFSPLESNESCDEAPVIVTKKPILSQSRVTALETPGDSSSIPSFTDRVTDIQFFDSPRLEC